MLWLYANCTYVAKAMQSPKIASEITRLAFMILGNVYATMAKSSNTTRAKAERRRSAWNTMLWRIWQWGLLVGRFHECILGLGKLHMYMRDWLRRPLMCGPCKMASAELPLATNGALVFGKDVATRYTTGNPSDFGFALLLDTKGKLKAAASSTSVHKRLLQGILEKRFAIIVTRKTLQFGTPFNCWYCRGWGVCSLTFRRAS